MATFIPADSNLSVREIQPKNSLYGFTLEEIQGYVQGYFEIRKLSNGKIMLMNEEAKLSNLPRNDRATALAEIPTKSQMREIMKQRAKEGWNTLGFINLSGDQDQLADYIAGDVIICENSEVR